MPRIATSVSPPNVHLFWIPVRLVITAKNLQDGLGQRVSPLTRPFARAKPEVQPSINAIHYPSRRSQRCICSFFRFSSTLCDLDLGVSRVGSCRPNFLLGVIRYPHRRRIVPMTPSVLLQKLRDLDRTSPHFRSQLINILRGKEYRDAILSLQGEDLTWFVNYLDNVSLHAIFPRLALTAATDSLRYLRSQQCPISRTTGRTKKDMWYQECAP